jgi:hypothetical protein
LSAWPLPVAAAGATTGWGISVFCPSAPFPGLATTVMAIQSYVGPSPEIIKDFGFANGCCCSY